MSGLIGCRLEYGMWLEWRRKYLPLYLELKRVSDLLDVMSLERDLWLFKLSLK